MTARLCPTGERFLADLPFFAAIIAAFSGLLIGSFLNVCIYRLPRDMSVVTPRSFCPECGTSVAWYDNIPVLSYALLRGKCRHCHKHIGFRYVFVELTTAALFAALVSIYGWTPLALKWIIFECVLTVLFWTDLEERLLLDELTLGGSAIGFVFAAFVLVPGPPGDLLSVAHYLPWVSLLNSITGALILALPFWSLGALYARVRKREGLGFGDVKLLLLLGAFLGVANGILAAMIGAVSGAIIGIAYILVAKKQASTYELPFGSFLCLGAAILPVVHWA